MDIAAATPAELTDFWFGLSPQRWFGKDPAFDAELAARFAALVETALQGGLKEWLSTPSGTLAYLLLTDQMPRNLFRDSARAFAGDALALAAAQQAVDAGFDRALTPIERVFMYLPFEHAEDLAQQDRSVALFERLAAESPASAGYLDYALRHREVIARFGRFPHRNHLLGRESTAEEASYLAQPGAGF
ncbi:DUF924 family protein [Chitinimonas lacunae]|uniref:DUF924 family protein n=1 Tax=Chitinimonas lacunae TaxID=1963018 RepID=A0ABV8MTL9_9NEIS